MPPGFGSSRGRSGPPRPGGAGVSTPAQQEDDGPLAALRSIPEDLRDVAVSLPRSIGTMAGAVLHDLRDVTMSAIDPGSARERFSDSSRTYQDVVLPIARSLRTTAEQGYASLNPIALTGIVGAQLSGDGEAARDAALVANPVDDLYEWMGYTVGAQRVRDTAQERYADPETRSIVLPIIEDIGNVALAAGGTGAAARIGGKVTGSSTLSNVGNTARSVARLGPERAASAAALEGVTLSPVGTALGRTARPLRTAGEATGVTQAARTRLSSALASMNERYRTSTGEVMRPEGTARSPRSSGAANLATALKDFLDPEARYQRTAQIEIDSQTRGAVSDVSRGFDPEGAMTEVRAQVARLDELADVDTQVLQDLTEASGVDLMSRSVRRSAAKRDGSRSRMSDSDLLAVLDAAKERGVRLAGDVSDAEDLLGGPLRDFQQELVRLTAYERANGLEPGTVSNTLKARAEMGPLAYTVARARTRLRQAVDDGDLAPEEFQQVMAAAAEDGLDSVRYAEQALPDPSVLGETGVRRLEDALRSYEEFSATIEGARIDSEFLSPNNAARVEVDEQGQVSRRKAGGEQSSLGSPAMSKAQLRTIESLQDDIVQANRAKEVADARLSAFGEDRALRLEEALEAHRETYSAVHESVRAYMRDRNPQTLDLALADIAESIARADDIAADAGGTPQYVTEAQNRLARVMESGTPRQVQLAETNLRRAVERQRRGNLGQERGRARSLLNDVQKRSRATNRAMEALDERRMEFESSTDAVPRAARPMTQFASGIAPNIASALRTLDDSVAQGLADDLDSLPATLDELRSTTFTDPNTGEQVAPSFTYVPDIRADMDQPRNVQASPLDSFRDSVAGPASRDERSGRTLADADPDFSRRQQGSDQPVVDDAYRLAQQQAVSTIRATMQRKLARQFEDDHAKSAQSILERQAPDEFVFDDPGNPPSSSEIATRMREMGYVRYQPNRTNPFGADVFDTAPGGARVDSMWVKNEVASMARAINEYTPFRNVFTDLYDAGIDRWRGSVLAFAPRWQVNNVMGNLILSSIVGKTTPTEFIRFMNSAIDLQRRSKMDVLDNELRILKPGPATAVRAARGTVRDKDVLRSIRLSEEQGSRLKDFTAADLISNEQRRMVLDRQRNRVREQTGEDGPQGTIAQAAERVADSPVGRATRVADESLQRLADRSYAVNATVDKAMRAMVYIAKGFDNEAAMVSGQGWRTANFDPDLGIRMATEALADYSKLPLPVRSSLRRVFPFITWTWHVVGALGRMIGDVNEIDRTVMLGHLVELVGEPNEEETLLPEYASGDVFTGYNDYGVPMFVSTRSADPFGAAFDAVEATGGSQELVDYVARSSGPLLGAIYTKATGRDALQGEALSGTPGPDGSAPERSWNDMLVESFPQGALVRDALRRSAGEPTTRLDDDTPFVLDDQSTERGAYYNLLRLLGAPVSRPIDTDSIVERQTDEQSRYESRQAETDAVSSSTFEQVRSLLPSRLGGQ